MAASHRTRVRRALAAVALLLGAGALWACDGASVLDPADAPGTVLAANDSIPGDTAGNPGGGQRTSLLVVQVGAQSPDTAAVIGVGPAVFTVSRGNNVVAVDSTTPSGYGSLQLAPGRYTVRLAAYPAAYQLAPGETDTKAVVLTPHTQAGVGFQLVRRP